MKRRRAMHFALWGHRLVWAVIFCCVVFMYDAPALFAQGYYSGLISAQTFQTQSVWVGLDDAHIFVPMGTLVQDTRIKIRENGQIGQTGFGPVPRQYRTRSQVYTYFFEGDFVADSAKIFLHYAPGKSEERKKVIFYQPILPQGQIGQWQRIKTIAHPESDTIEALLPASSGRLVFARHRSKVEKPTKSFTFTEYPGTPYSDTAAVLDVRSGKFLYRQDADKQRPIASISKLATTLVFLESAPNLSEVVTYSSESDRDGAMIALADGDQLSLYDVLMGTLIPSANNMAQTVSIHAGVDEWAFVNRMNQKMADLHLNDTVFVEPTGLNPQNVSTADNVARLARTAFTQFSDVYESAASYSRYDVFLRNSDRKITAYSTNKFDGKGKYRALAFKTGYLPPYADRTLVIEVEQIATGKKIIISLLGNPQYNTIFEEAYALADWVFSQWEFQNYSS